MYGPSIVTQIDDDMIGELQKTREIIDRDILARYKEGDPFIVVDDLPENMVPKTQALIRAGYATAGWSGVLLDVGARCVTLTL